MAWPAYRRQGRNKPLALVVLLENVGHITGVRLPAAVMAVIDYLTEEYAKLLLRLYGAYRMYDTVVILEDEQATGPRLAETLLRLGPTHKTDLLLLVHGHEGKLVGYRGQEFIGPETFSRLLNIYRQDPRSLDLRMVFGLNCYGASLSAIWLELGAVVANGTPGVNWLPEPSLSVFLRNWLGGRPYSAAVQHSNRRARRWARRVWRPHAGQVEHPKIAASRQIVYGIKDIDIHSRT
jgi:hypothetical protein